MTPIVPFLLILISGELIISCCSLNLNFKGIRSSISVISNPIVSKVIKSSQLHSNQNIATDESSNHKNPSSTIRDICSVAIPALAACIAEPALTLVDTYCVGKYMSRSAAVIGLTGMAVNGAIFNIIAAAVAPLCTGTTGIVSRLKGSESSPHKLNSSLVTVLCSGVVLSTGLGLLLMLIVLSRGTFLLRNVFGLQGEVLRTASQYLAIRALSIPSTMLNYVITGYSLGVQDMVAPLLSIVVGVLVNVLGDLLLVGRLGWGLAGAAAATTVSSYLGTAIALSRIISTTTSSLSTSTNNTTTSISSINEENPSAAHKKKPTLSLSPLPLLVQILPPIMSKSLWSHVDVNCMVSLCSSSSRLLMGSLLNTLTYSSGSRIAAFAPATGNSLTATAAAVTASASSSSSSTLHVAGHQIAMQSWWFLSFFSYPLSLAAQALLPREIARNDKKKISSLLSVLSSSALVVATLFSSITVLLPTVFPFTFTRDDRLVQVFQSVTVQAGISQFLICLATVADGVCIGFGKLNHYIAASLISTLLSCAHSAYAVANRKGIVGYWNSLLLFSIVRFGFYLSQMRFIIADRSENKDDKDNKDDINDNDDTKDGVIARLSGNGGGNGSDNDNGSGSDSDNGSGRDNIGTKEWGPNDVMIVSSSSHGSS